MTEIEVNRFSCLSSYNRSRLHADDIVSGKEFRRIKRKRRKKR